MLSWEILAYSTLSLVSVVIRVRLLWTNEHRRRVIREAGVTDPRVLAFVHHHLRTGGALAFLGIMEAGIGGGAIWLVYHPSRGGSSALGWYLLAFLMTQGATLTTLALLELRLLRERR